jgi:thiamine biosynthesis lipoprotein
VKPDQKTIDEALSHVGYTHISLDPQASTITLAKPGMQLDFGAIAKGYACDEALKVLAKHGLTRALVEAGGDMACGDAPPGKAGWTIAIEALAKENEQQPRFLTLKNCGVATSGDAYQFIEFDGVRYSHIVNPKTGVGLTHRSSVTVIAPDGTTADALASAVSVLGPERGKTLIEKTDGAEMLMISSDDNGTSHEVTSRGFHDLLQKTRD